MEFPDDLPSSHDKLDKNKTWLKAFQAIYYIKDFLSHSNEIPTRNDRQVFPEPCFHFSATTFLPPDLQYPYFSDFDPSKIIKILGDKKFDSDSELGVINGLKLSPEIGIQIDDQSDVVEILANLVKEKNMDQLVQLGGVKGLASSLCTNMRYGIHDDPEEVSSRQEVFGSNICRRLPMKSLFSLFLEVLKKSRVSYISLACGALSVGFGMKSNGPKEGWYDGVNIVLVMLIVMFFLVVRDFWTDSQHDNLALMRGETIQVEVVRSGDRKQIPVSEVVIGDIICLKIGDLVPADGLFVDGYSLQIDESRMTGESSYVDVNSSKNPFLISGTKVANGYATMLVTYVGMNEPCDMMMSTSRRESNYEMSLLVRLYNVFLLITKVGFAVAFLVPVVLFIWYFTGNTIDENGEKEFNKSKKQAIKSISAVVGMIASAATINALTSPLGLIVASPLTLAYSMKMMVADKILVMKSSALETMAFATAICTDKTGTLTIDTLKVTMFWIGQQLTEERNSISRADNVLEFLKQGVGLNTTGNICKPTSRSGLLFEVSGSPSEKCILSWATMDLKMDIEELKRRYAILRVEPFNSDNKRSGVLIKKNVDGTIPVHWKGVAEMIIAMCTHYYNYSGEIKALDDNERMKFERIIQDMAASSLQCIAFAYKQVSGSEFNNEEGNQSIPDNDLLLLALIGMKDECRPGVKKAVGELQHSGVTIKMVTGDDVFTAKAIATECGLLEPNQDIESEQVVEGVEFRNYTPTERMEKVDKICVMARSTPSDKLLMVKCLQQKGHVVAITVDGTNDAAALKESDIGLSMGLQGTNAAKDSSDMIIMDDNFASIVRAVKWGRCAYNNTQTFLQFQLTFIVAALLIIFLAAVSSGEVPLTVTQLMWAFLIMDTSSTLSLFTEPPNSDLMQRVPFARTKPVVSNIMWRNLIFQVLHQVITILTLQFKGEVIFKVNKKVRNTLIFNTFVLCQIFNLVNARKLEKKNIFKGLHRNKLFVGIIGSVLVLQMVMVEFLNNFAHTQRLSWEQWGACIAIAAVSCPLGFAVKFIPVPE